MSFCEGLAEIVEVTSTITDSLIEAFTKSSISFIINKLFMPLKNYTKSIQIIVTPTSLSS